MLAPHPWAIVAELPMIWEEAAILMTPAHEAMDRFIQQPL